MHTFHQFFSLLLISYQKKYLYVLATYYTHNTFLLGTLAIGVLGLLRNPIF